MSRKHLGIWEKFSTLSRLPFLVADKIQNAMQYKDRPHTEYVWRLLWRQCLDVATGFSRRTYVTPDWQ